MNRSERAIVALVLLAIAFAMIAPMLGRTGFPLLANLAMAFAAVAGAAAFAIVAAETLRAARARSASPERRDDQ
jgi:hypothetical protein